MSFRRLVRRRAFTLIELVVVLLILAAIAGLVIPQVAMLGRSTDMAASAKSQQDVASNIQLYFALQKRYPKGMDSLLDTTGAVYAPDTSSGDTQTRGLPASGANGITLHAALAPATLTNSGGSWKRSFQRSGFEWVYDHSTTATNANDSANTLRDVSSGDPLVAEVVPGSNPSADKLLSILAPNGLLPNERIVALGFGQRNDAIGKTSINAPVYAGNPGSYYGYYIAYFKLYANGERATLAGVSDCYGRTPVYTQQQFNESLPDGARQG